LAGRDAAAARGAFSGIAAGSALAAEHCSNEHKIGISNRNGPAEKDRQS
jgi:hypothetical protein